MSQSLYAGAFSFAVGLFDMKIDFKDSEPIIDGSGALIGVNEDTTQRITMSMPLAKELSMKLQEAISTYEKTFGAIAPSSELAKRAEALQVH